MPAQRRPKRRRPAAAIHPSFSLPRHVQPGVPVQEAPHDESTLVV